MEMEPGYKFLHSMFHALYTKVFSAKAYNVENVPLNGPAIIAANHMSNWDPMLISCFVMRPVGYMAKEELFKVPLLGQALKSFHSFPVKRGASDFAAIKVALNKLREGECMGMFPEGHRSKDGKLQKAATGVALIAAKSKAPVIPTAIINTDKIFKVGSFLPKLEVIYGEPLYFETAKIDKQFLKESTDIIMEKIQELINSRQT